MRIVFVQRGSELAQLHELYRGCEQGKGAVVVISGAVAGGKTELLHAFADDLVAGGALFLEAAGSRAEQALPLGVIGQLLHGVTLAAEPAGRIADLLREGAGSPEPESSGSGTPPHAVAGLGEQLLELAAAGPLVIAVDDAQHADLASLQCLAYIGRRLRSARILLLLCVSTRVQPAYPLAYADILRQRHTNRITLGPLTDEGIAEVLAERLDAGTARRLAPQCAAATGGNPLLVQAVAEDNAGIGDEEPLSFGAAFHQAVSDSLYRCDPDVIRVAHAAAVLDEPRSELLLASFCDTDRASVARALDILTGAGLVRDGQVRHPAARTAILDNLSAEQRDRLRRRSARVLHDGGAAPETVARHMVAARHGDEPWAGTVLQEAALQALAAGQPTVAADYLKLALHSAAEEGQDAELLALLAQAEGRTDPSAAARHLPELTAAVRNGRMPERHTRAVFTSLAWHGRVDDVTRTLDHLSDRADGEPSPAASALTDTRRLLGLLYPSYPMAPAAGAALGSFGGTGDVVTDAEQLLQCSSLDDNSLVMLAGAVGALFVADHAAKATYWCDRLVDESERRGAPAWRAVFQAMRGALAFRQGDLALARRLADSALTLISAPSWGVAIGAPFGLLAELHTMAGEHEAAAAVLAEPVPQAMSETPFGLYYLRARGNHHLAAGRHYAALGDFQECGRLLESWGSAASAVAPWRVDAGQALLRLDRGGEARVLAREQLDRLDGAQGRARGITLQLLAATSTYEERPALLREAVHLLQTAGARLELASVLADLSDVHHALGESNRARVFIRHAWQLAAECQATALCRALAPKLTEGGAASLLSAPASLGGAAALSDAELRVATLAAQGHTNRYIANRLYITTSTVEQHLTRVYRKLHVTRRSDLPAALHRDLLSQAG